MLAAPPDAVPYTIKNLKPLRRFALDILRDRLTDGIQDPGQRLHALCAAAELGQATRWQSYRSSGRREPVNVGISSRRLTSSDSGALAAIDARVREAHGQADWSTKLRLAIVAFHLGEVKLAADMLEFKNRPDPIQRTI